MVISILSEAKKFNHQSSIDFSGSGDGYILSIEGIGWILEINTQFNMFFVRATPHIYGKITNFDDFYRALGADSIQFTDFYKKGSPHEFGESIGVMIMDPIIKKTKELQAKFVIDSL